MAGPPIRLWPRAWGDNGQVLRAVHSTMRVGALIIVGVSTFPVSVPVDRPRDLWSQSVAFAVAIVTIALWMVAELSEPWRARLRWPLPLFATAMGVSSGLAALTNDGGPFVLLSVMTTTWAGSTYDLKLASAITGTGAVAVGATGAAFGVGAWGELGYPLLLVFGLLLGRLLRSYRVQAEQSAALLANAEQLRQEHGRAATLDERNRIAREIHDVLAHSLGALGVQIQTAKALLTDQGDVRRAVELLSQAQRMASDGLEETRRALRALRADTPALPEGLADLTAAHAHSHRAPVSFQVTGEPRSLSPDAGLALTRAAQEALVNTAKHAPHEPVDVRLHFDEGRTALTVVNRLGERPDGRGPGFETINGGYGLAGMRERLRLIDGSLWAGPDEGSWVVSAEVPQ
jgi:signal transduction histidine kinase